MSCKLSDLFGASSKSGRIAALVAFIALVAFFIGPFYWPASNAAWAAFLRILVLVSVSLYIASGLRIQRIKFLWAVALIFYAYLFLNAIFLAEDMQSARRLVFIGLFVFMVSRFWAEPVLPRVLLGLVVLMGACFSAFSLINLYRLGLLDLSYRGREVFSSGEPGLADFGNTIVAAMHYAFCYCVALWLLLRSKSRSLSFLWAACLGIVGFYIIFTFARTGWMACLISSCSLLILTVRYNAWHRILPIALCLVGLLVWFGFNYLSYEVRVRGLTDRADIWLTVLHRVELNLFWGHGAGAKMEPIPVDNVQLFVKTAHSTYLEVLYQFGLVGLFLMLGVILMAMKDLWSSALSQRELGADSFGLMLFGAAAVVMLVELSGFVDSPNLLWIWFWLPLGIALSQTGRSDVRY